METEQLIAQPAKITVPPPEDPPIQYTTSEEMEKYAQLMEGEYHEISPADHKRVRAKDIFYRVVHLYPQLHGIGLMEKACTAMVVVERYKKERGPNGDFLRKPHRISAEDDPAGASFTMKAAEFLEKYRQVERE